MKTMSQGTATIQVAALDPDLSGSNGAYLSDCQVVQDIEPWASEAAKAKDLWDLSEKLVGKSFVW